MVKSCAPSCPADINPYLSESWPYYLGMKVIHILHFYKVNLSESNCNCFGTYPVSMKSFEPKEISHISL